MMQSNVRAATIAAMDTGSFRLRLQVLRIGARLLVQGLLGVAAVGCILWQGLLGGDQGWIVGFMHAGLLCIFASLVAPTAEQVSAFREYSRQGAP